MPSWKQHSRPDLVAEKLEEVVTRGENGQVTFEGFEHLYNMPVIASMLDMSPDLSEKDKESIIHQATFRAAGVGLITKDSLLRAVKELTADFLRQPRVPYVLVTSITVPMHTPLKNLRVGDATLTFSKFLPRQFQRAVAAIEEKAERDVDGSAARLLMKVRVRTEARSPSDAFSRAINALDFVRSVWNWLYNHSQWVRSSHGSRKPVNRILLGPLHTLHTPAGAPAASGWWYEDQYTPPGPVNEVARDIGKLLNHLRSVKHALARSCYAKELRHALLQYGRALDERDWTSSFLQLWRVLEALTANPQDSSYEKTVRRTAFLYLDYEYHRAVLSHLRELRNRSVHHGEERQDMEACMYQLKNYVEKLLAFHLFFRPGFSSLGAATEMLDMPPDPKVLRKRLSLTKRAIRFHSTGG